MDEQKQTYRAQEQDGREPAYYATIPASVRYEPELRPSAKLLFGELTALCDRPGYCWASNRYFAELYNLSDKTISELLLQLEQRGHIRREVIRDDRKNVIQRRIYAGVFYVVPSPEKSGEGSPEKSGEPPPKNPAPLNRYNNTSNNNTPIVPTITKRFIEYSGNDRELLQRLVDFAEMRQKIRSPIKTDRQVTLLLNRLDTLSGGDASTKRSMLDEAVEKGWKSVYAPKADYPQRQQQAPRSGRREDMPL